MKRAWYPACLLLLILLLTSCGTAVQKPPAQSVNSDSLSINIRPTPTPMPGLSVIKQEATPTPTPVSSSSSGGGSGLLAYGPPPAPTALETQLTQQLFQQINQDRATRGLYAYTWNATLAAGALLHSWDMYHCGFSHTCPDGEDQCTRIGNEGFTFTDCGECIGLAGPSTPPWTNVYAVQESMINEPPDGWHRIHLTSTTLHRIGVGIYVAPDGWVWFTEDIVS